MNAKKNGYEDDCSMIEDYCENGSDRAATAFMRKYQNFVFATALRYVSNYDDADDLTQETFIRALGALKSFKKQSSVKTWLYRITVNTCINFRRKKSFFSIFQKNDSIELDDLHSNSENPEIILENSEFEEKFLKILSKLPEKQRETFSLRYFEDMSYDEISEAIGTGVGGLKANYFHAVKKLGEILKKEQ